MTRPVLTIAFENHRRWYRPGETLRGTFAVEGCPPDEVRAVEFSILWHTEGKGDEDFAVHDFRRIDLDQVPSRLDRPQHFETVLPPAPLSYDGRIVKIRWCARLRVFLRKGRELVDEEMFRLGMLGVREEVLR